MRTAGVVVGTSALAAVFVLTTQLRSGLLPAHDLYAYFLPKALYALGAIGDGGRGLLWNPYQNCGQPFFGVSQTGLLYPPYLAFLLFDPGLALDVVVFLHLVIAGVGSYLLGRSLGLGTVASLATALTFEMGNAMIALSISSPTHAAPYAWLPIVLWCTERLLHAPSNRRGAGLAVALTLAILPGMPQVIYFTYQLIALRVGFELLTRRARVRDVGGALLVGVGAPLLLSAVQLLPEMEVARASLRSRELSIAELYPFGPPASGWLTRAFLMRDLVQPLLMVPAMLVPGALLCPRTRRMAVLHGFIAITSFGLALGPETPFFSLYAHLPGGSLFRDPRRFFWVTAFSVAVLSGLGLEGSQTARRRTLLPLVVTVPAGLWALAFLNSRTPGFSLSPFGAPGAAEWIAVALVLAGIVLASRGGARGRASAAVLLGALAVNLVTAPRFGALSRTPELPGFFAMRDALAPLAERLTAQDRVLLLLQGSPMGPRYEFMAKTASLLRLRSVLDYEPLMTRRYAEFSGAMRGCPPVRQLQDALLCPQALGPGFARRLLDLAAVRYLVAPSASGAGPAGIEGIRPLYTRGELTIFENLAALPRAVFVPRVEVVVSPEEVLERLAHGTADLRTVALVEGPQRTTDTAGDVGARVQFERDDPEHVILSLDAPAPGFVVLSDQWFPGWDARVNGVFTPIARANYAFRLVEVPAGRVLIDFRYRPLSVEAGMGFSIGGLVLLAVLISRSPRGI